MSLPSYKDSLLRRERRNWFSAPPNTSAFTQQEPDDDSILEEKPTHIPDKRRRSTNASSVTTAVTDLESQLPPEEELKPPPSNSASPEKNKKRERRLSFQITPRLISDATIGLSDGLTVPFALTAGLSALGDTRVVIFGGLAELIAGAISMGLGGYLGAKSEAASYNETLAKTQALVDSYYSNLSEETTVAIAASSNSCRGRASISDPVIPEDQDKCNLHVQSTTAQEHPLNQLLSQIFIPFSPTIPQETLDSLTDHLLDSANTSTRSSHRSPTPSPSPSTTSIPPPIPPPTSNQPLLVPFLMRFHHCLPPPSSSRPLISALTIATSYFLGGLLPLIPYFFVHFHSQNFSYNLNQYPKPELQGQRQGGQGQQGGRGQESLQTALYNSIATMSLALFGFGYVKTCIVLKQWSGRRVVRKGVRAGVQMVVVGGIAAGAAMGLVKGFDGLLVGGGGGGE